jgi:hypothetical protein
VVTSGGKLDALQQRVLEVLSTVEPPFTLGGGGALAGVHLGHRTTRDLDLFWREIPALEHRTQSVVNALTADGLSTATVQSGASFVRLRVADSQSAVVLDLIAEPMASIAPAVAHRVGGATILVDPPRAILVDKLCALLSRSELRDLIDVEALVASGEDLPSAIDDAPRRDSGFSRLTLAWVLRDFDVRSMAVALGYEPATIDRLEAFRQTLIESLIAPGETSKEHSGL